jgi:hypothetical protein
VLDRGWPVDALDDRVRVLEGPVDVALADLADIHLALEVGIPVAPLVDLRGLGVERLADVEERRALLEADLEGWRDTRMLVGLLDQLESVAELAEEGQQMGKRIFHQVTMELDRLEREGYFGFARAGIKVADRLVHDYKPEDVESLGIRVADALKAEPPADISLFDLLRAMGDQKVRRGLYRSLNLLKAIGD